MSKLNIIVFSLLGLTSVCVGQIIQNGQCLDNVAVVSPFNASAYLGVWYDIESLPSTFQTGTCNTATYTLNNDGTINVQNTQISNSVMDITTGTATVSADAGDSAKLDVVIGLQPAPYWVLATDYETFALVYSCRNLTATTRQVNSWKLGRNKGPLPAAANTTINSIIANVPALSQVAAQYVARDHSAEACNYFVDLTGPCPSVTGMANFDVNRYVGTWLEFARYPQTAQSGQCNRAEYALGATTGVYTVQNSQVINETLGTMSGVASGTGRPGELAVTFVIDGTPRVQNLTVLTTDYDNYALVYSCAALAGNRRRIGSWQLRRNFNELSTEATNAINNAITNTPDLQQAYYQTTQQTDEACFYYPDFTELPEFIQLRGSCDTSVAGVSDFSVTRFLGTWYEEARLPQTSQTGQCNRAEYGEGTTGVTVRNSQVTNEQLSTIYGTATTTNQSGVLAVTFNINGQPKIQYLYVLATDYDNYALLYSCENIVGSLGNQRRIGSWRMRRNFNPLTTEATNAINNAIDNTQGLRADYYQQTSQTDDACFYYPNIADLPGLIELPGSCDTTITGVANFDLNRYLGTWLEVARYPQTTQTGQCNRAVYGEGATSGVVTVQNSQVVNELLATISGTATGTNQTGVLAVSFNVGGQLRTSNLYVLATDYESYSVAYSCQNIEGNRRRVGSWQLRRNLNPLSEAATNAINSVIDNTQGLRAEYYRQTSQTDEACFYYPNIADLPGLIELPGPCNTAITGVANFDVSRYLGTWLEVARYPQTTQTGQCNRAVYDTGATSGVVTVQNSQVVNELLATISGTATGTNQSGVLAVSFNVGGQLRTQNLYVLATDYESYSVAYSCQNIEGNRRRVGSWQLRRNLNPLSEAATNAINSVIDNTQGLRAEYYRQTSQTDEACFYYPNIADLPGLIELPGPCNTAITGVANFDVSRYLGTWLEVARYPQTTQTGQCNRAVYGVGETSDVVTVQNSQVINELLATISGTATGTNQSGVLAVSFNVSGQLRTQNLYVLATDYESYSVAYSCQNIEGNRRRVGSWLLQRNLDPLSQAATNAINSVISSTQGLRTEYYRVTQQTAAACWYYPPQEENKPVVIPGQCDTTISGVSNINLTGFADSIWYHIRRYDAVENRTCIATKLSRNGDTNIDVNSIEVIGNAVNRTRGVARLNSTQTGKFELEMTNSEKIEIYVLATDIDNYAIAYSCRNEGDNQRQIGAWLLSRTRTWPTAGNAALNILITGRQEFTDRPGYFKDISHNEDCPEPSSAFLFRSSIIMIFVCTVLQLVW